MMQRNDSAASYQSNQSYIPNAQSLYGGSTSANTSTQINISHIRFNTADTLEMQQTPNNVRMDNHVMNMQNQQSFLLNQKPPLPPQLNQERILQQINNSNTSAYGNNPVYKTYPPNIS